MGRRRRRRTWLSLLLLWMVAPGLGLWAGCDAEQADAPPGGGQDAGAPDGQAGAAGASSDGAAGAAGGSPGDAACPRLGELGEPCSADCDCLTDLACRGLLDDKTCSVPCYGYGACANVPLGCAGSPYCEFAIGACRCPCTADECPGGICHELYCVGCSNDDHCAEHSCPADGGIERPVCRLDTETCVCGGRCGDGVCDERERAGRSCPTDCAGPCADGESLPYDCGGSVVVPWCVCSGSQWDCTETEPWRLCPGETDCERMTGWCLATADDCSTAVAIEPLGCEADPVCCLPLAYAERCDQLGGSCVPSAAECTELAVTDDPYDCTAPSPVCCIPRPCLPAGTKHPPGYGQCCPGQRELDYLGPMPAWGTDGGMSCNLSCGQLTCAPCGDGACQHHFNESSCNCPEDCPETPFPLVCTADGGSSSSECGRPFCRQQAGSCHAEIPLCSGGQCTREVQELAGYVCDPTADGGPSCVPGP